MFVLIVLAFSAILNLVESSSYDNAVLADKPITYYQYLDVSTGSSRLYDVVGKKHCGIGASPIGSKAFSKFPKTATDNTPNFVGKIRKLIHMVLFVCFLKKTKKLTFFFFFHKKDKSHFDCGDDSRWSIPTTGTLTIEFWAQPTETTWSSSIQYGYILGFVFFKKNPICNKNPDHIE